MLLAAFFIGGGLAVGIVFSTDTLWALASGVPVLVMFGFLGGLMRCGGCGRSGTWWGARHVRKGDFLERIRTLERCPYCGHSE